VLDKLGFKLTDPGRFQNLTDDFGAQIAAFKQSDCQIITGVVIPPDFTTFWNQANQRGFKPKVASVGKALLFPSALEALGKTGHNLSTEVWWTPTYPFKSSLTGISAADLGKGYEQASKRQWTQQIGFAHALFEVAIDVLKRSADPTKPETVVDAIAKTNLETIVGPIAFGSDKLPPFARKNIAKTPLVGGQWRLGGAFKYELVIVDNATAPIIPVGGTLQPIA
jgi:branched-chain amino acid transport system substrate-binding protein